MTMKFNVKLEFESFAIRTNEGKVIFRTTSPNEVCDVYDGLFGMYEAHEITTVTERAFVDCEVVTANDVVNNRHMTTYSIYVNDKFVKKLTFRPYHSAVVRAITTGLDWKIISNC